jgi:hypothetical protein
MPDTSDIAQPEIVTEMHRLVEGARTAKLHMRLIGGLAVRVHSPNAEREAFRRDYPDMDFVVHKKERRKLDVFFAHMGYLPDKTFNILNGDRRQIFFDAKTGRRVDVFVGDFEMCHKLPMRGRLEMHPVTVPLAELFLSKTQIVELNRKDALDLVALLLDNEIGFSDEGTINVERITRLCLRDWGLYKTMTINLSRVEHLVVGEKPGLSDEEQQVVLQRINTIRRVLSKVSKPLLWKVRDRVGTRIRWYTEVEEVDQ